LNITEVRVKLLGGRSDRLRAFCSVTLDDEFVVHDLRVIEGRKGLFVAMPSRKLSDNCPSCGGKNHLRAKYCSECGAKLDEQRARDRDKFHVDVAHPIAPRCREFIQSVVLEAYEREAASRGGEASESVGSEEEVEDYDDYLEAEWEGEPEEPPEEPGAPGASEVDFGQAESPAPPVRETPEGGDAEPRQQRTDEGGEQREAARKSDRRKRHGRFGEGIL